MSRPSACRVSSSLNRFPSSPRSNSKVQPGYLNPGSPPGASMTPSSDTNSVTTIRAAISRSPLLQLVAYRLLLTPEHLHSQTHVARDRSNASSHAEWWRTARHDRLPNHATFGLWWRLMPTQALVLTGAPPARQDHLGLVYGLSGISSRERTTSPHHIRRLT